MTNAQYIRTMGYCNDIIKASQKMLTIAKELGDEDVDMAIMMAESIQKIAAANETILQKIKTVDIGASFDKLKDIVDIPTNGRYNETIGHV